MRQLLLIFLIAGAFVATKAQPTAGTTGLLNIPTADMQPDGTFMFGGNYLPEPITPKRFAYNTGNYYINITFLPFWEVNYRLTLLQTSSTGRYNQQDRSFALRCRLLGETKYIPSVVVGGNDVYTSSSGNGNQNFGVVYAVATKNFHLADGNLSATLGYGIDVFEKNQYEELFCGIAFSPGFFRQISFIAEFDSKVWNTGGTLLLFDHLYFHTFAYDLKYLCGGIAYKVYLKPFSKNK
jgi:hypothetical protein